MATQKQQNEMAANRVGENNKRKMIRTSIMSTAYVLLEQMMASAMMDSGQVMSIKSLARDIADIEKNTLITSRFEDSAIIEAWNNAAEYCVDSHIQNLMDTKPVGCTTQKEINGWIKDWEEQRPINKRIAQIEKISAESE